MPWTGGASGGLQNCSERERDRQRERERGGRERESGRKREDNSQRQHLLEYYGWQGGVETLLHIET